MLMISVDTANTMGDNDTCFFTLEEKAKYQPLFPAAFWSIICSQYTIVRHSKCIVNVPFTFVIGNNNILLQHHMIVVGNENILAGFVNAAYGQQNKISDKSRFAEVFSPTGNPQCDNIWLSPAFNHAINVIVQESVSRIERVTPKYNARVFSLYELGYEPAQ